jgi:hypothetical protein
MEVILSLFIAHDLEFAIENLREIAADYLGQEEEKG